MLKTLIHPTLGRGDLTGRRQPDLGALPTSSGPGRQDPTTQGHGSRGSRRRRTTVDLCLRDGADGAELGVADVPRAGGVADIPVPQDPGHRDGGSGLVALSGPHVQTRAPIGVRDACALEEPSGHPAHRAQLGLRGADAAVVAHHGQAHGAGVDATGVRPDAHLAGGSSHGAGASFEDGAVLVDEEVVADVAPVQGDRVVVVDAPHDGGGLPGGVVVGAGSVVDDDVAGALVVGVPAHVGGVGAPLGAGGDRHRQPVGSRPSRHSSRN